MWLSLSYLSFLHSVTEEISELTSYLEEKRLNVFS